MDLQIRLRATPRLQNIWNTIAFLLMLAAPVLVQSQSTSIELESSYRFLVSDRETAGGVLYLATAGQLQGKRLPLSFVDSAPYWGDHVCQLPGNVCTVTDTYNPQMYTLLPQKSLAGDLQTERINTHDGANIYDTATWQIAVMLGHVINHFKIPNNQDAYALVSNQNQLLQEGYSGNASHAGVGGNRAITADEVFVYNHQILSNPKHAYTFRMLPRNWLSSDPFAGTRYADQIKTDALPVHNPDYQPGKVTWTDWKPITGENAWAFLIGPLHAAYIHYVIDLKGTFIPYQDRAVQNALDLLPTFAAMQSPSGAVYYAPAGTVANQGDQLINPYEVAVENTFSLYAGLNVLRATLQGAFDHQKALGATEKAAINKALQMSDAMINGGTLEGNRQTAGLLAFFKDSAWRNGEFVQGGFADDPKRESRWIANSQPKAVDVNTWGIAALGARQIDQWYGFGAAYQNWQQVKQWGGYGVGKTLWGVGFSDQDGNGLNADGTYRQGILSTEWTAGAILMVRNMLAYYQTIPQASSQFDTARRFLETLERDEQSMLTAIKNLRIDYYAAVGFPGQPHNYAKLFSLPTQPYLYASKRYLIPFGWYANPLPSTCATAWMLMLENRYNPFAYGGKP